MQRLFSMFPQGGPGVALLLLRISVAGIALFSFRTYGGSVYHWVWPGLIVIAISLCIGFLTPIFAVFFCILGIYYLSVGGAESAAINISAILNSVALAFLGPGAYSFDAWRFGRRVVTVSPRKPRERS
jgi:uncharacterized membrane protein YphA (DoxX/SURF4 family)